MILQSPLFTVFLAESLDDAQAREDLLHHRLQLALHRPDALGLLLEKLVVNKDGGILHRSDDQRKHNNEPVELQHDPEHASEHAKCGNEMAEVAQDHRAEKAGIVLNAVKRIAGGGAVVVFE